MDGYPWLKNRIFDRMFELSSNEISFLLYVTRYQDQKGHVTGVHYKDVCDHIFISTQTFYTVLYSLKEKGFIDYEKNHYTDYDITILDNDFTKPNERKGYIVLTDRLFELPEFHALKAGEKLLALYIYRYNSANDRPYQIGCDKFIKKWQSKLKVTVRVLKGYLHKLKSLSLIFSAVRRDQYVMGPMKRTLVKNESIADRKYCHRGIVGSVCRRNRVKNYGEKEMKDTCELLDQYTNLAKNAGKDVVICLGQAMNRITTYYKEHERERILEPAFVNSVLKAVIYNA